MKRPSSTIENKAYSLIIETENISEKNSSNLAIEIRNFSLKLVSLINNARMRKIKSQYNKKMNVVFGKLPISLPETLRLGQCSENV